MINASGLKFTQRGLYKVGVDVSLLGVNGLADELERMVANAAAVENEALQAAATPILEDAQHTTAFIDRSGDLRKSLRLSKVKFKKSSRYILVGQLDSEAFYARMVEFGTSTADAHPFLEPAFEQHRAEAQEIIANHLREALGK
jgi:HK97 gp10 family phage protein